MFAPNAHQLSFAPRAEANMSNSLQAVSEATSFFTDNVMMGASTACFTDGNTFPRDTASDSDLAKGIYNLRPRGVLTHMPAPPRLEPEGTPPPVKPKRQRNSLKKRLLVNARERDRMRVLNNGFQALRDALPCYIADGHMAKITTLRLAINYIKALNEVLSEDPANGISVPRCTPHAQQPCTSSADCNSPMMAITSETEHFKTPLPIDVSTFSLCLLVFSTESHIEFCKEVSLYSRKATFKLVFDQNAIINLTLLCDLFLSRQSCMF